MCRSDVATTDCHRFGLRRWLIAAALASTLAGCTTLADRPPPLTTDQVVQMSQEGRPSDEIMREIDRTRTILALNGSQYARLKAEGVSDEVLDHLQSRYVRAVELDARMRYQGMHWGGWGWGWGWGWGPPPPYRPFPGYYPYWYW